MIADWAWPPNQAALSRLFADWPTVRHAVPTARLLIAGRGSVRAKVPAGVEVVGEVSEARDVLSRAAVLAFPCPPTSGPKMKVLEALSWGLPVVTTPAGVEGIAVSPEAVAVVDERGFADELAAVLRDPQRRTRMAALGRADLVRQHAPQRAAALRLELIEAVSRG
jgi:glycosyltransferase involved in cell wall biosynthesis